jgi:hypothetical protein
MGERAQIVGQAVVVLAVLAAASFGIVSSVTAEPPKVAASTPSAPDASLIASTMRTPAASPASTRAPTPAPSPAPTFATLPPAASPTPTPRPIALSAYSLNGRDYTGVEAAPGTVFVAPFDARVEVVVYQIIEGEFRSETDLADRPSYPYLFLYPGDGRVMKLRPGALKTDTEIVVRESEVRAGTPLFRVVGTGASSWQARYDATVGAQVIVSLETAAGADLDAARFIKTQ